VIFLFCQYTTETASTIPERHCSFAYIGVSNSTSTKKVLQRELGHDLANSLLAHKVTNLKQYRSDVAEQLQCYGTQLLWLNREMEGDPQYDTPQYAGR